MQLSVLRCFIVVFTYYGYGGFRNFRKLRKLHIQSVRRHLPKQASQLRWNKNRTGDLVVIYFSLKILNLRLKRRNKSSLCVLIVVSLLTLSTKYCSYICSRQVN